MESKLKTFDTLVQKKEKNFGDKKALITFVRTNNLHFPDIVLEYGLDLLKNHSRELGEECKLPLCSFFFVVLNSFPLDYLVLEDVANAAIESDLLDLAKVTPPRRL